ncbi:MAG: biopolymer transporter ExbD [Spirochaetia bacterium]|jgi:biopolymer transport protein ExbD|nr:biopolymer transporter ExbD [Spirochaetia bacterium]
MVFKRRLKPVASIDLIPMIDVIFQLVVFFMVSSTFIITPGIPLEFPDSTTAEPVVINKIIVTIISEDELYLNDERTSLTSLVDNISSLPEISIGDSRSVIIEGDRRASYSLMVNVLDILRETGFTGINLRMREAGN